ncbi:hypothetical protein A5640_24850 [Mycobacterium asiaticum]|uniref:Uncharacterized protein n=1 Tax=Mycobacterium asiaticum TaxID=1790 RepID=A0A1A3L0Z0_MYCAS|nr:hypothetical protein A5640_24850 [Mycobacterium asiaticum]
MGLADIDVAVGLPTLLWRTTISCDRRFPGLGRRGGQSHLAKLWNVHRVDAAGLLIGAGGALSPVLAAILRQRVVGGSRHERLASDPLSAYLWPRAVDAR